MSKTSLSREVPSLKQGKDGWYQPVYAQGGGTKVFWSYCAKTKAEAEKIVNAPEAFTVSPPIDQAVTERIFRAVSDFRREETKTFNKQYKMAFYTDAPHRFDGDHADNPTRVLFDAAGARFDFIRTEQILAGELEKYRLVFCPGGFGYFPCRKMKEAFRSYLRSGGGFIGFCAGAFMPFKDCLDVSASGFVYLREQGFTDVLLNPRDPVANGLRSTKNSVYALTKKTPKQRSCSIRFQMFRANGPLLVAAGKDKAVGYHDSTLDISPIVRINYGKGRLVPCGPHPDTSIKKFLDCVKEADAVENFKLFKNMILYCARIGS